MSSWHSYPKIWNLGHAGARDLLFGEVLVEEKIDGSQFSFGVFDGVIKMRSKGVEMDPENPEKMFSLAVDQIKAIKDQLHDQWTYRGEFLSKPKHNTLAYERVPKGYIIIFDINSGEEEYLGYTEKYDECTRLGLECIRRLYAGPGESLTQPMLMTMLDEVSVLGWQKIEGVVIKNYWRFGLDKKVLMGKHVSEAFKEIHGADWKERNPKSGDILEQITLKYRTPARWAKAVQHLKERGVSTGTVSDIGNLMRECQEDFLSECEQEVKDMLWGWAKDKVTRSISAGLPQWFKEQLLAQQFEPIEQFENIP